MTTRWMLGVLLWAVIPAGAPNCNAGEQPMENPFWREFDTPFAAPPFERIKIDHYAPAFERGIERQLAEVAAIADNDEAPTFENTIERLERSGELLTRVGGVFFNLTSADTSDELQALAREINPKLAKHRDDIYLNERLFARVKAVYDARDRATLGPEARRLLDETYRDFVRGGANLPADRKARFREINTELSVLSTQFSDNLLKQTNAIALLIEDEADLIGLPQSVRDAAAAVAAEQGHAGKWGFTLQRTSWTPFLQFSPRRDLREKLFKQYITLCSRGDELDNRDLAARMAALRAERAALLGYATHADYVLERSMAATPARVSELLDRLWKPALASAKRERAELQALGEQETDGFRLAAWDWWFYAEKLRKAKYDFDEEAVRPYLALDKVSQAAFDVARRLWGVTFTLRTDVPVYHPDVKAYEVRDADGSPVGLFYADYFTRGSKRGGAWMNNYREQRREGGQNIRPIIVNVCNFAKPAPGQPALLSLDEADTVFHEFGHAMHGLLANSTYASLSGTNVPRDFVEFPSQMMENWALAPKFLPTFARHYETGEPIPAELVQKLQRAKKFNQGFATTEYLAASLLDMAWHTLRDTTVREPLAFEAQTLDKIGLIPEIASRYRTPYFAHIFGGGYSASYYSYIWAEVLDADAFEAFRQQGLFDPTLARSYRTNILERGNTEPPMELYRRFRGADPQINPLLERRGLTMSQSDAD